jgi:hypothetical protein
MNVIYYKYIGIKQGKHLYEMWKMLDRSDIKRCLIPDKTESHLRTQAAQLLGIREGRLIEVKE